jgi:hypothetical protein
VRQGRHPPTRASSAAQPSDAPEGAARRRCIAEAVNRWKQDPFAAESNLSRHEVPTPPYTHPFLERVSLHQGRVCTRDGGTPAATPVCKARHLPHGDGRAAAAAAAGALPGNLLNPDGSSVRRLTYNDANDVSPAWSPAGRKIAFISNRDGSRQIYVMNADGSGQTRLTSDEALYRDPAWSGCTAP